MIPSHSQADEIGRATGKPYEVFSYVHGRSGLTAYAVRTSEGLVTQLPRAAAPAHPVNERN